MVLAEAGKFVGAKIASAIIFVGVAAGGIWCAYNWDKVEAFGHVVKLVLFWLVIAAALPWSSYLFMRPVLAFQGNLQSEKAAAAVSVGLIGAFLMIDVFLAWWMNAFSQAGGFTWFVLFLGFAAAGAYNFIICESLARHVDR